MAQQPKTGFRFEFGGVNLTSVPDSLPPEKFSSALNVRGYSPNSIRTRPGYAKIFGTGANTAITDLQSFSAIETDNNPDFLLRDANGSVWLGQTGNNNAALVGNMNGPQGFGASMLPFRPNQSPQTWVYVATEGDYQKFSPPDANNTVTQYKVGIAEGQSQLEAAPIAPSFTNFTGNNSNWTASGTAVLTGNGNIVSDTVGGVPLPDPVIASRQSVPVAIPYYLIGSLINVSNNNASSTLEVQDVLPPIATCNVNAIRYAANNNGHCQIVCGPLPIGEGPTTTTILGGLRRGAIVNISNNSSNENAFVLSALSGPNGSVMFECSTTTTRSANDTITGVNAIVVDGTISSGDSIAMPSVDATIGATAGTVTTNNLAVAWVSGSQFSAAMQSGTIIINAVAYQVAAVISPTSLQLVSSAGIQASPVAYSFPALGGVGTISRNLSVNPFAVQLGTSGIFPTEDDYVRLVVLVQDIAAFQELEISFIADTYGTFTYTTTALQNLAAGELAIVEFPISALIPSGTNISLAQCTSVEISVTSTSSQGFDIASLCISGGGLPDIGDSGAPYQYQIIGRSAVTGAPGNPNPVMRYGVSPRRQSVLVPLPSVASQLPASDPQVNIWDVYRYGGSITSYQYIGSGVPGTNFTDQYFDDTAEAGKPLPTQNFEPWPSVDVPWNVTAGGGITIAVTGTNLVVTGAVFPATISRWLPGTLVLLGGQTGYTLRKRPIMLSSTSWLFDLVECVGNLSPSTLSVNEPFVARQFLPYTWGPDANGYIFGTGDPLRPGVVSFATPNQPDVTASTNTNEPSTPSETLMGGAILAGFSFVASSDRWWQLYPTFQGNTVFTPFQVQVGRGLASPYGICTDKTRIFFWAKDGIGFHAGGPYQSLTDLDLYLLFPHEATDAPVNIVRNGVTYYAPDYSRAATFRLAWVNDYLYADYQDSTGTPRTLVCFLKTGAWVQDQYANSIISRCALVQPEGTLTSSPGELYDLAVMADNQGNIYAPSLTAGDNGAGISALVSTFEWDGQPSRNSGLWEDFYIDGIPVSGLAVQPVMFGQAAASIPVTNIGASSSRILANVPVPDGSLNRFLGLQLSWTDAPGSAFTLLHSWRNFADPDSVFTWKTSKQTFGLHGYLYCGRLEPTYSSTAPVTLNLTAFDGTSAATMTIPSTGGLTQKILVTPTFNKGQLLSFSATSAQPFQLMPGDSLLWVRQWGSTAPWLLYPLGAEGGVKP